MTALAALVWLLAAARATPMDALDPLARRFYESGVEAEASGDCARALSAYALVLEQDASFVPARLGDARCRYKAGQIAAAVEIWRGLPDEAEAVESLARHLQPEQPAEAATLYRRLRTLRLGDPEPYLWEASALTTVDPLRAREALGIYLGLVDAEPDGAVLLGVAVALRDTGHEAEATSLLEEYLRRWPDGGHIAEAQGRLDRWSVETAARALAVGGAEPLDEAARRRVEAARRQATAGELGAAVAALREVVRDHPRAPEAWGGLAEVLSTTGEVVEAERAWSRAAALAPDEPDWHARLGQLLADRYGGRRDAEAAAALGRALALRPGWAEVQLQLAAVLQRLGRWAEAATAYESWLRLAPDSPEAPRVRAQLEDLRRPPPDPEPPPEETGCGDAVSDELCTHYRVARVYQLRGEPALARDELEVVLEQAPSWPPALNLQAALAQDRRDTPAAVAAWTRSLAADPRQPTVLMALAEQRRAQGDLAEAERLFREAAGLGASEASYWLAELAWARGELDASAALLDAYFDAASTGSFTWQPALALREQMEARARRQREFLAIGLGVTVVVGLVAWLGRRRGATIAELAAHAPESVQELSRILAALRHEVLKHNTTLLPEVAAALDRGDHAAVGFAANRLFGEGGSGGILERFDGYLGAIERLGRGAGLPLDLRRKDPVLGPMCRAMRRLRALERPLRRPGRAPPALVREISALSEQLNVVSYRGLGRLIREISTLTLDAARLRALDGAVRAEPAFAGQALPELHLEAPEVGLPVRVTAGDLDDIVTNLLRNAYRVVGEELPPGKRRVGLAIDEEDDPVTGLETVLLRFRDNAPRTLTADMIRDREAGRGLGLVRQLVTRNNGSVTVERERGWAKAVVVRLPRADAPDAADTVELASSRDEPGLGGSGLSPGGRVADRLPSGPELP